MACQIVSKGKNAKPTVVIADTKPITIEVVQEALSMRQKFARLQAVGRPRDVLLAELEEMIPANKFYHLTFADTPFKGVQIKFSGIRGSEGHVDCIIPCPSGDCLKAARDVVKHLEGDGSRQIKSLSESIDLGGITVSKLTGKKAHLLVTPKDKSSAFSFIESLFNAGLNMQ